MDIFNSHKDGITHLVPEPGNIFVYGDTATLCGLVTDAADKEGDEAYPICTECEAQL